MHSWYHKKKRFGRKLVHCKISQNSPLHKNIKVPNTTHQANQHVQLHHDVSATTFRSGLPHSGWSQFSFSYCRLTWQRPGQPRPNSKRRGWNNMLDDPEWALAGLPLLLLFLKTPTVSFPKHNVLVGLPQPFSSMQQILDAAGERVHLLTIVMSLRELSLHWQDESSTHRARKIFSVILAKVEVNGKF